MFINQENLRRDSNLLQQNNYLRVSNFLEKSFAKKLSNCLENDVDWGLAFRLDNKPKTVLSTPDIKSLKKKTRKKLKSQFNHEFQFVYNTYMMVTAYLEQRDPDHYLDRILEWLNTPYTKGYFKQLTGNDSIVKINAQATRYLPGHFLTQHNDENSEEGRQYAYVIGMSKDWNPDWGGLLHILNEKGDIVKTLIPEYNSLSIFKVPQNHFVSYVSPFAQNPRLGITGWLLNK